MRQSRLPPRSALGRTVCASAGASGWLVSRFGADAPLPADLRPESVPFGALSPAEDGELLIAARPPEGFPEGGGPLPAFPRWILAEEAEAVRAYASSLAGPDRRHVYVLHAGGGAVTLWNADGGTRQRRPLGLSLIDRMILRANTHPGEWGGLSGALQLPPDADTDALLAQCASLRRQYSDAEREGLTEAAITAETPCGTLRVSMEMMCALLEDPDPWILGEHLDGEELAALSPEERGMSWAGAVSRFLRGAKGETPSPGCAPVLILAGEAARMEQLRALAAECFGGFHLIPDPSGADPAHAGLCLLTEGLTEAALRREAVLRLCEWLEGAEAHGAFLPMLKQACRGALSGVISLFQDVWKAEAGKWASKPLSSAEELALSTGLIYKNEIGPKCPSIVEKEALNSLRGLCRDALAGIAEELGCALTPAHAEYAAVSGALGRKGQEMPELDRAAAGISRYMYRRMTLYNCAAVGAVMPFRFLAGRRPPVPFSGDAVSSAALAAMKKDDLEGWETAPEQEALAPAADILLADLSHRIGAAAAGLP